MKIQRMIERPMDYQRLATKPKDRNQLALLKQGFMPAATLTKGTRSIDPRRRKEILNDLHEAEVIGSTEKTSKNGRYTNIVYFAK